MVCEVSRYNWPPTGQKLAKANSDSVEKEFFKCLLLTSAAGVFGLMLSRRRTLGTFLVKRCISVIRSGHGKKVINLQ